MAMTQSRNIQLDLDRHRQVLEDTVSNLQSSLVHWQQWYFEYSALKEEVVGSEGQTPGRKDLARIRRDFDGELLNRKELNEIFGKHDLKEPEKILNVLSRRMDYVEQNVESLTKQLEAAENKLAASMVVAKPDGATDEQSGLPITDIIEELDDDGNVVDFRLQTGSDTGPQVLEALKKAGVEDLSENPEATNTPTSPSLEPSRPVEGDAGTQRRQAAPPENNSTVSDEKPGPPKSVSFADDTKPGHDAEQRPMRGAARRLQQIMQAAKDQEAMAVEPAIIPGHDSPEDAQLRREMLEYGMSEIGPVVAELQLDEGFSDAGDDDHGDYSDGDQEDDDIDDDDEDELDDLGRSKCSVITDDYRRRMQELEKRLGVQSSFAAGPVPKSQIPDEGVGRVSVVSPAGSGALPYPTGASADLTKPVSRKGVRFAQQLDIALEGMASPLGSSAPVEPPKVNSEMKPLSDIVERKARAQLRPQNSTSKQASRFKKERSAESASRAATGRVPSGPHEAPVRFLDQERRVAPSGPDGKTMADAIVERDAASEAGEPSEFDATLLHQETAVEFNRMRNRLIHKQGGFLEEEEAPITPLDEEEGGPKRMSRFKAARLSRQ